jgi:hypothetical protein
MVIPLDYSSDIWVWRAEISSINLKLDGIDDKQDRVTLLESQVSINTRGIADIWTASFFQISVIL